jgi:hypothetical protein
MVKPSQNAMPKNSCGDIGGFITQNILRIYPKNVVGKLICAARYFVFFYSV